MDGSIPSPLASTGHRTVVASAGFLRWAMLTEGGIMQGVIHLLQGGHGPGEQLHPFHKQIHLGPR